MTLSKEGAVCGRQWFSKCGPQTCNFSVTWEAVRNAGLGTAESETTGMVSSFLCFNKALWVF